MPREIPPSPRVSSSSAISSPFRMRSMSDEVRTREHAEVLAVLAIDALDALGDHDLDPRVHLRVRRRLARRTLPAPRPRRARDEPAGAHRAAHHRELLTGLEAEVGEFAERLVEVVADVGRRDLVGRDVVAQLRMRGRSERRRGVERKVLAGELAMQQRRILGEQEDASNEADAIGDFLYGACAETLDHTSEDACRGVKSQATWGADAQRSPTVKARLRCCEHCDRSASARDRGDAPVCHDASLCDRVCDRAGRRADRDDRDARPSGRGATRGDRGAPGQSRPFARSLLSSRRSPRRSRLSERMSRRSLPRSRRSPRRSRRSERISRVSPRTSPDRSGATAACAPAIVEAAAESVIAIPSAISLLRSIVKSSRDRWARDCGIAPFEEVDAGWGLVLRHSLY